MNARQAIVTKYHGPTNVKGSRIKATAYAGSIIISYDDSLNSEGAHTKAAQTLAAKLGWHGNWHIGGMPNDAGYVFVNDFENESLAFSVSKEERAA